MEPNNRPLGLAWATRGLVAAVVALGLVGLSLSLAQAQAPAAKGKAATKPPRGKGKTNIADQKKVPPNAADPLAAAQKKQAAGNPALSGTYHFRLKIHAADDATLAASYYPVRFDTNTPIVLLIHEKDRSSKDFEDPIDELKKTSFAEHLQSLGYAVLAIDLRGYGSNPRRQMSERDWGDMVYDLQSAYIFLLDRHNRGQLNVAKLGVVALGEGANLAAAWAYEPGGAVSHEGRTTDISGLVLVSPLPEGSGFSFPRLMNSLAPRIPLLLMAGERDASSHDAITKVRANVEKTRQNKVELFPSSLHGYKLLRLEPRATSVVLKFLESTVKLRPVEWEPRYNLAPVTYSDVEEIRHIKRDDEGKAAEQEKGKEQEKEKGKEAPKAQEKAGGDKAAAPKDKAKAK
jgi:pimeloyl-ACP methyl ester carboxylesterase